VVVVVVVERDGSGVATCVTHLSQCSGRNWGGGDSGGGAWWWWVVGARRALLFVHVSAAETKRRNYPNRDR
jgi:hypothetical protein